MTRKASIGRLIGCIHRHAAIFFEREMAQFGLGSGNHFILMMLYSNDGISQNCIAQHMRIDKALTTRTIRKLIDLDYVRREMDENDARAYRIYLTDKGLALKPHIKLVLKEWSDLLTEGFSIEEKQAAITMLERMAENVVANRQ
ncbi:MarR family transcriptional regulator [bacterium]|nr:MarR family transcriptional regulator [bacterium]